MINYFSKLVHTFSIKTKESSIISKCIETYFYLYGVPLKLLSDQGHEFVNQVHINIYIYL